jgi:hypothetical protein
MAAWSEVEAEAPELVALARSYLDAFKHKTLATLRRDGSPRISGIEVQLSDGELWFGSMTGAVKVRDLRRDARFALHSGSPDPDSGWTGDAKLAGRAVEITDPAVFAAVAGPSSSPETSHLYRADLSELSVVRLGEPRDHLVIESWHAGRGVTRRKRY